MKGEIIKETGWYELGSVYKQGPLRRDDESFFTATDCFQNEKPWVIPEDN